MTLTADLGPDETGTSIRVEGGRIIELHRAGPGGLAVSPAAVRGSTSPATGHNSLDAAGARLEPGRVNAHTHIYSGLAPLGLPPPREAPRNFIEILERIWWRLDRALDPESLRAAARYYIADALLAGTSLLVDHHESPQFIDGSLDVLADACQELGMRAVLCYGATERNGGRDEARKGLGECRRFIRSNDRPLVRGVVGLHASFTVSNETLEEAAELCREMKCVLHVHVAEDEEDLRDAVRRGFKGPLERLLEFDALPKGSILAHGVHLDVDQVQLASEQGLWFVQNPRSNRGNGVGYPRALHESSRVALGTDGYPARMADERAALLEEARRHGDDLEASANREAAGRRLAAELFGEAFEPLAPGGAADVAVMEEGRTRHLMVGGRAVVDDGQIVTADLDEIMALARAQAPRLWARMEAL
jgi:cytosine/adenosine deaminase-related metal-dependent hydrolase